jgi:hypothetical protein
MKNLLILIIIVGINFVACEEKDIADICINNICEETIKDTTTNQSVFVAAGGIASAGKIYYSHDGIDWNETTYSGKMIYDIVYNNKIFSTVGENGEIWSSLDGITWTQENSGVTSNLYKIKLVDNLLVAIGDYISPDNIIISSEDGTNWNDNSTTYAETTRLSSMTFYNGSFFTIQSYVDGPPNKIHYYKNNDLNIPADWDEGIKNLDTPSDSPTTIEDLIFINNQFIAIGSQDDSGISGKIFSLEADELNLWEENTLPTMELITGIIYNNEKYIIIGKDGIAGKIFYSVTSPNMHPSLTWNDSGINPNGLFKDIIYGENKLVTVGMNNNDGLIYYSTNNVISFSQASTTGIQALYAIAYKND